MCHWASTGPRVDCENANADDCVVCCARAHAMRALAHLSSQVIGVSMCSLGASSRMCLCVRSLKSKWCAASNESSDHQHSTYPHSASPKSINHVTCTLLTVPAGHFNACAAFCWNHFKFFSITNWLYASAALCSARFFQYDEKNPSCRVNTGWKQDVRMEGFVFEIYSLDDDSSTSQTPFPSAAAVLSGSHEVQWKKPCRLGMCCKIWGLHTFQ